ncbi:hypothetical protein HU200_013335 [Digitaria exilis]|uniref:F-box domain-containing protein n=1 Tax=Digitaria exilis TaxID=1010633 RepID=A0A835KMG1_9POAL|nr:hypothetical protein HU200_013335 [Digitaria exilis]CAB3503976.1 unnamed protein product [Digitaria exilis]
MEEERRRKKRKRTRLPAAEATSAVHNLSDDLLELVLLGLDSPLCLIRAAATCKRWRHVVADADGAFLRRFRSVHPPRAIGTYYNTSDEPFSYGRSHLPPSDPVFVPSSTTVETDGNGPGGGLQLTLDFVPCAGEPRDLVDGRGSLLLLFKEKEGTAKRFSCDCLDHHGYYISPDLVVCEPLTRRYQAIPPPDHGVFILGAFLLDVDDADEAAIAMTNFRVLLVLYEHDYDNHNRHGYPSASVFNTCGSSNPGWCHGEQHYDGVYLPRLDEVHLAGRTGGRVYWSCDDKQVVVMDEHTLEFSNMALTDT